MPRLLACSVTALLGLAAAALLAAAPAAAGQPAPQPRCTVEDDRLAELSGLAADGQHWYAVPDGGRRLQVAVLRKDCTVQRMITATVDPYDVEDLALGTDGRLWLADVGDNSRSRETIAVHVLTPQGSPELYRMTYPDGPHDAEALLLDREDRPYVITKEILGGPGVYRPTGPLSAAAPTPLERVATVRVPHSDTPGGPTRTFGATMITGAATGANGTVVALRTYTDAYLYPVPEDGDVAAALAAEPVVVPLPDEPQGEAIAFEPDGALLSASERATAGPQPIRAVAGVAALVGEPASPDGTAQPETPSPDGPAPPGNGEAASAAPEPADEGGLPDWQAFLIAIVAAGAVVVVISRVGRRAG